MEVESRAANRRNNTGLIVALVALLIAIGMAGVFYYNWQKDKGLKDDANKEVVALQKEKSEALNLIKGLEGKNEQLDSLLSIAKSDIEKRSFSIDSLLRMKNISGAQLAKAKGDIGSLKKVIQGYLAQMDVLKKENGELKVKNTTLETDLSSERGRSEELTKQNSDLSGKVSVAAQLKATDFTVKKYRVRNNGKESEGEKAKNVDHVRVSFNLQDNPLSLEGPRDVYMRLVGPDGSPMYQESAGSGKIMTGNTELQYTVKKNVVYTKALTPVSMEFDKGSDFAPGTYTAEVYTDGVKVGTTNFSLR